MGGNVVGRDSQGWGRGKGTGLKGQEEVGGRGE